MKIINKNTWWVRIIYIAVGIYVLFCVVIFLAQGRLLFPAHAAMQVPKNWQPKAGSQTFLAGSCGKLHVAKWPVKNEKGWMMIFHGNAESLASVEYQVPMFQALGYSVVAWDYAGYGQSDDCWSGEQGMLQDAQTAYTWLKGQTQSPITIYGRSLGTGPAVYIASKYNVQRLLLASPYDSLANVASENMPFFVPVRLLMRFPLASSNWIKQVKAPIYAIHGLADTLIKPARAAALLEHRQSNTHILWVKNIGHDIDSAEQFESWLAKSLS